MSILKEVYATENGFNKGATLSIYEYSDGSIHCTFRDRLGRPSNVDGHNEAEFLIETFNMQKKNRRIQFS